MSIIDTQKINSFLMPENSSLFSNRNLRYARSFNNKTNFDSCLISLDNADLLFELLCCSANNITALTNSVSEEALYYLKKAAMMCLTQKEFIRFFNNNQDNIHYVISQYVNIRDTLIKLSIPATEYWDSVFGIPISKITSDNLFGPDFSFRLPTNLSYFDGKRYRELQEIISDWPITIIRPNGINSNQINLSDFDYVDFSSILCKISNMIPNSLYIIEQFISLVHHGVIVLNYCFGIALKELDLAMKMNSGDLHDQALKAYSYILKELKKYYTLKYIQIDSHHSNGNLRERVDSIAYTLK